MPTSIWDPGIQEALQEARFALVAIDAYSGPGQRPFLLRLTGEITGSILRWLTALITRLRLRSTRGTERTTPSRAARSTVCETNWTICRNWASEQSGFPRCKRTASTRRAITAMASRILSPSIRAWHLTRTLRGRIRLLWKTSRQLVDAAHNRGIYVIFDIVLNHAGDVFEYVLEDGRGEGMVPWRNDRYSIRWRDADGRGRADWSEAPVDPPPMQRSGRRNCGATRSCAATAMPSTGRLPSRRLAATSSR